MTAVCVFALMCAIHGCKNLKTLLLPMNVLFIGMLQITQIWMVKTGETITVFYTWPVVIILAGAPFLKVAMTKQQHIR